MPIAIMGGLDLDANNNREYPGSGGMVGGWSPTTRNLAWISGAGEKYHSFTPPTNENIPAPIPCPDGSCLPGEPPEVPGPGPTTPYPTPAPGPTTPPEPPPTPPTIPPETPNIPTIIDKVLSGLGVRRGLEANQPLNLYTPAQPQVGGGGIDMRQILILGAVIAAGFFLYKRFA